MFRLRRLSLEKLLLRSPDRLVFLLGSPCIRLLRNFVKSTVIILFSKSLFDCMSSCFSSSSSLFLHPQVVDSFVFLVLLQSIFACQRLPKRGQARACLLLPLRRGWQACLALLFCGMVIPPLLRYSSTRTAAPMGQKGYAPGHQTQGRHDDRTVGPQPTSSQRTHKRPTRSDHTPDTWRPYTGHVAVLYTRHGTRGSPLTPLGGSTDPLPTLGIVSIT